MHWRKKRVYEHSQRWGSRKFFRRRRKKTLGLYTIRKGNFWIKSWRREIHEKLNVQRLRIKTNINSVCEKE